MNLELIFLEENVLNMNFGLIVRCIIVITSAGDGWRLTAAVGWWSWPPEEERGEKRDGEEGVLFFLFYFSFIKCFYYFKYSYICLLKGNLGI